MAVPYTMQFHQSQSNDEGLQDRSVDGATDLPQHYKTT
jgi:hypothetical protein